MPHQAAVISKVIAPVWPFQSWYATPSPGVQRAKITSQISRPTAEPKGLPPPPSGRKQPDTRSRKGDQSQERNRGKKLATSSLPLEDLALGALAIAAGAVGAAVATNGHLIPFLPL